MIRIFLLTLGILLAGFSALQAAERVLDVTKAGVVGDGTTLNTAGIQKAIDDCSASGGGTLLFPAGRYLTGTIQIKSGVTLRLAAQATLLGSTDAADYRNLDPFIDGSGNPMGYALIVAVDADHVGIEGAGAIDGQDPGLKSRQQPYRVRPFMMRWVHCTRVTVRGVHLINPGAWTLHFFRTRDAEVSGVTIRTRAETLANTDGIDIDSSQDVRVRDCDIDTGDDALVIKSTSTEPSRDLAISDCKLSSRCNAIKLGTESYGGFGNISISGCQVRDTGMSGIALNAVDGGDLRGVRISDVTMDGVAAAITVRLGSRLHTFRAGDQPKTTGHLADVSISNVTAKNIKLIGILINGVPSHPVENITLQHIKLELPGGGKAEAAKVQLPENAAAYPEYSMFGKTLPAYGIYARHVLGINLKNVRMHLLNPDARPGTMFLDVAGVTTAN